MPTRRFYSLLVLSFVLYLFANQTQVGWLYIIVGLLLSLLMLSRWVNQKGADGVTFEVDVIGDGLEFWEGDEVSWQARLSSDAGLGAFQYQIEFDNPLIDPADETSTLKWYLSHLPADGIQVAQTDILYKRGLHQFEPAGLSTRFPFGLFARTRAVGNLNDLPTLLVYPELKHLERFPLLDEKLQQEAVRPKIGNSHEVLSVRPYRQGDSLRHIHWRSVARTGELISKEFASDADLGVTLWIERNLDLKGPAQDGDDAWDEHLDHLLRSKTSPFETAVKVAAAIGEYMLRQTYPLYIGDDVVQGAVTEELLWTYLARVEPHLLLEAADLRTEPRLSMDRHIIYLLPFPDEIGIERAIELKQTGRSLTVILFDSQSYPLVEPIGLEQQTSANVAAQLRSHQVDTLLITSKDDWVAKLTTQIGERNEPFTY